MPYDAQHALDHPEVAGWALGALDPDDAAAFGDHLQSCGQCQAEVAEFAPVARSLALAAPAGDPPPDLEFKTVAAVRYAAMAETRIQPEPAARPEPAAARAGCGAGQAADQLPPVPLAQAAPAGGSQQGPATLPQPRRPPPAGPPA